MQFPDRLKSLRQERGLTQTELAKQTELSSSTIAMYETGKREPNFETLELLADYFNADINYLLGKESVSTYCLTPKIAELAEKLKTDPYLIELLEKYTSLDARGKATIKVVLNHEYSSAHNNLTA